MAAAAGRRTFNVELWPDAICAPEGADRVRVRYAHRMTGTIVRLMLVMTALLALGGCATDDPAVTARDAASVPGAGQGETRMSPSGGVAW